jgi:SAM-dependent methyltransferase
MPDSSWSPADILQLSGGYWSACALHAGVKLDVFTHLSQQSSTADSLAEKLQADPRGLTMLLNSLTAIGLLVKSGEEYADTPFSADFLAAPSPKYLGHIIMHHHHLMAGWARLDRSVTSGAPTGEAVAHTHDERVRESFEMGMFDLAMLLAPRIVPHIDLNGRRRLLDLGGGPGTYAIHFCKQNPGLEAVVYDLPTTRVFAENTVARFDLSDRISFEEGDFISEGIAGTYDVAWLSHILHGEGPEGCAVILEKAMAALNPGGLILIQEFILNDTFDGPLFPALFSLNMLLGTTSGRSYSESQLEGMLSCAGAVDIRRLPLELPNGAGVICGTVPG